MCRNRSEKVQKMPKWAFLYVFFFLNLILEKQHVRAISREYFPNKLDAHESLKKSQSACTNAKCSHLVIAPLLRGVMCVRVSPGACVDTCASRARSTASSVSQWRRKGSGRRESTGLIRAD